MVVDSSAQRGVGGKLKKIIATNDNTSSSQHILNLVVTMIPIYREIWLVTRFSAEIPISTLSSAILPPIPADADVECTPTETDCQPLPSWKSTHSIALLNRSTNPSPLFSRLFPDQSIRTKRYKPSDMKQAIALSSTVVNFRPTYSSVPIAPGEGAHSLGGLRGGGTWRQAGEAPHRLWEPISKPILRDSITPCKVGATAGLAIGSL